jgi:hypothetical protein
VLHKITAQFYDLIQVHEKVYKIEIQSRKTLP